jgi:hypothetical protein
MEAMRRRRSPVVPTTTGRATMTPETSLGERPANRVIRTKQLSAATWAKECFDHVAYHEV